VARCIEKIKIYGRVWKLVEVRNIDGEDVAFYEDQYGNIRAFFTDEASYRPLLRRRLLQGWAPLWLVQQAKKFKKERDGRGLEG